MHLLVGLLDAAVSVKPEATFALRKEASQLVAMTVASKKTLRAKLRPPADRHRKSSIENRRYGTAPK